MLLRTFFQTLLIVGFLVIAHNAAAQLREIELTDGSVITGTLRSFDGDTYVIDSETLGTISLGSAKVRAIRSVGAENPAPQDMLLMQQHLQQQLLSNGEIMEMIKALQNDPQIQSILRDPQLLQAISSGDVQTLMNNEKFKALVDHPKIREISGKVAP